MISNVVVQKGDHCTMYMKWDDVTTWNTCIKYNNIGLTSDVLVCVVWRVCFSDSFDRVLQF